MKKRSHSHVFQEKEIIALQEVTENIKKDVNESPTAKNDIKDNRQEYNTIKVGICVMEKKSKCKPMQEILTKLNARNEFTIIIFEEETILKQPIQNWPVVDCLIAFDSSGFPLKKCQEYVELTKPYLLNDLKLQEVIKERYKVYQTLRKNNLPTPTFYFVTNDEQRLKKYEEEEEKNECMNECFLTRESSATMIMNKSKELKKIDSNDNVKQINNTRKISIANRDEESNINVNNGQIPGLSSKCSSIVVGEDDNIDEVLNYLSQAPKDMIQSVDRIKDKNRIPKSKTQVLKSGVIRTKSKEQEDMNQKIKEELKNYPNNNNGTGVINHGNGSESIIHELEEIKYDKEKKKFKFYHHSQVEEYDDYIMIGENRLNKPFVEKPFDADDHNINIYYAQNDGGGCKKLFRKIGNVSSNFDPNINYIRRDGDYIYEEFLPTDGFDIKVYTVGTDYAHAETRKSPVLDGRVLRTKEGKEVRYPVNLTPEEKIIAKKIVIAFEQQVCGFDLLRSKGKSFVCDVNGWSFVKGNKKYYTDCAILLRRMIWARFCPEKLYPINSVLNLLNYGYNNPQDQVNMLRPDRSEKRKVREELRSVVSVFRHGDRTPKQKMKMTTRDPRFLSFFDSQPNLKKEIKLKTAIQLQKVLDITRSILFEMNITEEEDIIEHDNEKFSKLMQLLSVLEKTGHFEGINRKIQLKPVEWSDDQFGPNTRVTELLFILKWGGELTHTGVEQAIELGAHFRENVYPIENAGVLRLHNTYRHDMKIYSSNEGRCQKTAAAFAKGFLELEGDLTPILVGLVRKDDITQDLLDFSKASEANPKNLTIRDHLSKFLNCDSNLYETVKNVLGEEHIDPNMKLTLMNIGNPLVLLKKTYSLMKKLTSACREILSISQKSYYIKPKDMESTKDIGEDECEPESMILIYKRWRKLEIDFYNRKKELYDVSKIPDVYYSIRYDILHNKDFVQKIPEVCRELFDCIHRLADFVIPGQFGITESDKVSVGYEIISNLLKKIKNDLIWWNKQALPQDEKVFEDELSFMSHRGLDISKINGEIKSAWRHVKSRLYFTSASHLYSLFNVIHLGFESYLVTSQQKNILQGIKSLDYLSHILIKLYENLNASPDDPKRFRLELSVSQGCAMQSVDDVIGHKTPIMGRIEMNSQLNLTEIEQFFDLLCSSIQKA